MDVIFQVVDALLQGLAKTYGLDWITMFFAIMGGYYLTKKDIRGLALNVFACCSSFALAVISDQYGFIIYNLIFGTMMLRAYANWSKEEKEISG